MEDNDEEEWEELGEAWAGVTPGGILLADLYDEEASLDKLVSMVHPLDGIPIDELPELHPTVAALYAPIVARELVGFSPLPLWLEGRSARGYWEPESQTASWIRRRRSHARRAALELHARVASGAVRPLASPSSPPPPAEPTGLRAWVTTVARGLLGMSSGPSSHSTAPEHSANDRTAAHLAHTSLPNHHSHPTDHAVGLGSGNGSPHHRPDGSSTQGELLAQDLATDDFDEELGESKRRVLRDLYIPGGRRVRRLAEGTSARLRALWHVLRGDDWTHPYEYARRMHLEATCMAEAALRDVAMLAPAQRTYEPELLPDAVPETPLFGSAVRLAELGMRLELLLLGSGVSLSPAHLFAWIAADVLGSHLLWVRRSHGEAPECDQAAALTEILPLLSSRRSALVRARPGLTPEEIWLSLEAVCRVSGKHAASRPRSLSMPPKAGSRGHFLAKKIKVKGPKAASRVLGTWTRSKLGKLRDHAPGPLSPRSTRSAAKELQSEQDGKETLHSFPLESGSSRQEEVPPPKEPPVRRERGHRRVRSYDAHVDFLGPDPLTHDSPLSEPSTTSHQRRHDHSAKHAGKVDDAPLRLELPSALVVDQVDQAPDSLLYILSEVMARGECLLPGGRGRLCTPRGGTLVLPVVGESLQTVPQQIRRRIAVSAELEPTDFAGFTGYAVPQSGKLLSSEERDALRSGLANVHISHAVHFMATTAIFHLRVGDGPLEMAPANLLPDVLAACQLRALLLARDFVVPDDLHFVLPLCSRHRVAGQSWDILPNFSPSN